MSSFIGWRLAAPQTFASGRIEEGWPSGRTSRANLPANQGLIWNETREPISTHLEADAWAVVDGSPRWLELDLAEIARQRGHGAAAMRAWRTSGTSFVTKLRGSFALAVVDERTGTSLLAVDRFGSRPLAFAELRGGLVFASNVEALRRHAGVTASLDLQAVYDYFFFHVVPSPQTIYRGIAKLEPGQMLVNAAGRTELRSHWTPQFASAAAPKEVAELRLELLERLKTAVERCAPRPGFGSYLSGGLDSSAVSGLLAQALRTASPAYCVGFEEVGYDEMGYARIAARHFGLDLREIYATPDDVADVFAKVAVRFDEPFGNSSAIPAYLCARRAADDGVHDLMGGDGGDEVFGGNERYVKQRVFDHYWRIPRVLRSGLLEPLFKSSRWADELPVMRKVASYVKQASMPMPDRTQSYNLLQRTPAAAIFAPEFLASIDVDHPFALLRTRYRAAETPSPLSKQLYMDWKFTLADNDLRKVTGSAQLADVAVHYPMLDDDLVDLSLRVPDAEKIVGDNLRAFYKAALADFLPAEIIAKKKHGFGLPFGEWLNKSAALRTAIFDSLESLKTKRIVREDFLDDLTRRHREEHAAYYGVSIWVFAMFARWLDEHGIRG